MSSKPEGKSTEAEQIALGDAGDPGPHEPKARHWSERIPIWRSIKAIQRQVDSLEARHQAQLHWHQHQINEYRERANQHQSQLMRHRVKLLVQQDELSRQQEESVLQQEQLSRQQEALNQHQELLNRYRDELDQHLSDINHSQDQTLQLQNQFQTQHESNQELDARFSGLARFVGFEHAQNPVFDSWYQNLQDLHRGSGEALAQTQSSYLPYFESLFPLLQPAGPILDLGCGRGEWLSLLATQGWQVRGVDSSELAVQGARENGLDVQLGDLLTVLEAQPANSLAAVTAFQVIEHLPFECIVTLVHSAFRALLPG
ncbi:MAG: methyltransferase domain-containing protein, partial [Luminiphilus sp.]|nr:methyltransferase domain-containing protein [Luminiphilus sp.]